MTDRKSSLLCLGLGDCVPLLARKAIDEIDNQSNLRNHIECMHHRSVIGSLTDDIAQCLERGNMLPAWRSTGTPHRTKLGASRMSHENRAIERFIAGDAEYNHELPDGLRRLRLRESLGMVPDKSIVSLPPASVTRTEDIERSLRRFSFLLSEKPESIIHETGLVSARQTQPASSYLSKPSALERILQTGVVDVSMVLQSLTNYTKTMTVEHAYAFLYHGGLSRLFEVWRQVTLAEDLHTLQAFWSTLLQFPKVQHFLQSPPVLVEYYSRWPSLHSLEMAVSIPAIARAHAGMELRDALQSRNLATAKRALSWVYTNYEQHDESTCQMLSSSIPIRAAVQTLASACQHLSLSQQASRLYATLSSEYPVSSEATMEAMKIAVKVLETSSEWSQSGSGEHRVVQPCRSRADVQAAIGYGFLHTIVRQMSASAATKTDVLQHFCDVLQSMAEIYPAGGFIFWKYEPLYVLLKKENRLKCMWPHSYAVEAWLQSILEIKERLRLAQNAESFLGLLKTLLAGLRAPFACEIVAAAAIENDIDTALQVVLSAQSSESPFHTTCADVYRLLVGYKAISSRTKSPHPVSREEERLLQLLSLTKAEISEGVMPEWVSIWCQEEWKMENKHVSPEMAVKFCVEGGIEALQWLLLSVKVSMLEPFLSVVTLLSSFDVIGDLVGCCLRTSLEQVGSTLLGCSHNQDDDHLVGAYEDCIFSLHGGHQRIQRMSQQCGDPTFLARCRDPLCLAELWSWEFVLNHEDALLTALTCGIPWSWNLADLQQVSLANRQVMDSYQRLVLTALSHPRSRQCWMESGLLSSMIENATLLDRSPFLTVLHEPYAKVAITVDKFWKIRGDPKTEETCCQEIWHIWTSQSTPNQSIIAVYLAQKGMLPPLIDIWRMRQRGRGTTGHYAIVTVSSPSSKLLAALCAQESLQFLLPPGHVMLELVAPEIWEWKLEKDLHSILKADDLLQTCDNLMSPQNDILVACGQSLILAHAFHQQGLSIQPTLYSCIGKGLVSFIEKGAHSVAEVLRSATLRLLYWLCVCLPEKETKLLRLEELWALFEERIPKALYAQSELQMLQAIRMKLTEARPWKEELKAVILKSGGPLNWRQTLQEQLLPLAEQHWNSDTILEGGLLAVCPILSEANVLTIPLGRVLKQCVEHSETFAALVSISGVLPFWLERETLEPDTCSTSPEWIKLWISLLRAVLSPFHFDYHHFPLALLGKLSGSTAVAWDHACASAAAAPNDDTPWETLLSIAKSIPGEEHMRTGYKCAYQCLQLGWISYWSGQLEEAFSRESQTLLDWLSFLEPVYHHLVHDDFFEKLLLKLCPVQPEHFQAYSTKIRASLIAALRRQGISWIAEDEQTAWSQLRQWQMSSMSAATCAKQIVHLPPILTPCLVAWHGLQWVRCLLQSPGGRQNVMVALGRCQSLCAIQSPTGMPFIWMQQLNEPLEALLMESAPAISGRPLNRALMRCWQSLQQLRASEPMIELKTEDLCHETTALQLIQSTNDRQNVMIRQYLCSGVLTADSVLTDLCCTHTRWGPLIRTIRQFLSPPSPAQHA
jgi:hypothetical protein